MTRDDNNNDTNNTPQRKANPTTFKIDHEYGKTNPVTIHAVPIKFEFFSQHNDILPFLNKHKTMLVKLGLHDNHLGSISPDPSFKKQATIQQFLTTVAEYKNFVNVYILQQRNNYKVTITHYIITHLSYRDIHTLLLPDLTAWKVFLNYNYWHRTGILDTVNIGWFLTFHPSLGSKSQLKNKIIRDFYSINFSDTEKEFIKEKFNIKSKSVHLPKFYFNNTSVQTKVKNNTIQTKVTAIQAHRANVPFLQYLLFKLFMETEDFNYPFIPLSLRYTHNNIYTQHIESHNLFLSSFHSLPIQGIPESVMFSTNKLSLYNKIMQNKNILAVEPTAQTLSAGTWNIHTTTDEINNVQPFIDALLSELSSPNNLVQPKRLSKYNQPDYQTEYANYITTKVNQQYLNQSSAAIQKILAKKTNQFKQSKSNQQVSTYNKL